jgi:hypothetical protein
MRLQHVIPPALRLKRPIPLILTMTSSGEKSPLKLLALGMCHFVLSHRSSRQLVGTEQMGAASVDFQNFS